MRIAPRARRRLFAALLTSACAGMCAAEEDAAKVSVGRKRLTLEAVFPEKRADALGGRVTPRDWLDDDHWLERGDDGWLRVAAADGSSQPAYDRDALAQALEAAGVDSDRAKTLAKTPGDVSAGLDLVLIRADDGGVFVADLSRDPPRLRRVRSSDKPREHIGLSPGGRYLSFIRENDLHVVSVESGRETRLTRDGAEAVFNGVFDWVYQEELYGRGQWRAHWWREDERYLAYLRLDDRNVPLYPLVNYLTDPPTVENVRYPRVGEPNPTVRLGVIRPSGWGHEWVDLDAYADRDILISHVSWAPDGRLIFCVQDREQTWLDLCAANPANGRSERLAHESSPAWVEVAAGPQWLADGSFLWLTDRDGWRHIEHRSPDGALLRRVTSGDWSVSSILAVRETSEGAWVYFSGNRETPLETQVYRVPLAGGPVGRLTALGSSHRAAFSADGTWFIDSYSAADQPTRVALHAADGKQIRALDDNPATELAKWDIGQTRFVTLEAGDGYPLSAQLFLPSSFDPTRRYPLWVRVYAGPTSQTVRNSWSEGDLFLRLVAAHDVVACKIDPRSGGGRGAVSSWQAHRRLGRQELADIEDAVRGLISQGYIDESRIGISGHSYGGFMVGYALTHSDMFSAGLCGSPVLDWREYDSVYTERYMGAAANEAAYDAASALKAAESLRGELLIYHGLMDDNVHPVNTLAFARKLQKENKDFELMIYPQDRHGIYDGRKHYQRTRLEFILRTMGANRGELRIAPTMEPLPAP